MTEIESGLALYIVKENYGEIARSICGHLVKKKSYPLMQIAKDLDLDIKLVGITFR
jgi:hypothetical protein